MKAFVNKNYGGVENLRIKEIEKPTPGDNEVLIKIHASSVNAADWRVMRGDPYFARMTLGIRSPKINILGADVSGTIVAIGKGVTNLKIGDEVFADFSGGNRPIEQTFGTFAEFVKGPAHIVLPKPAGFTFEDAAAIPLAAITALQGLKQAKIKADDRVLINGASGGVGTFAVQIAKALGAHVTAVCSTSKIEIVESLGADEIIDYTRADFTKGKVCYDLILAANGDQQISNYKTTLTPKGRFVMVGGSMKQLFQTALLGPLLSRRNGKQMSFCIASSTSEDLRHIKELAEHGKIKPVIEKVYSFEELPNAIAYVEKGHAKGKLVIRM